MYMFVSCMCVCVCVLIFQCVFVCKCVCECTSPCTLSALAYPFNTYILTFPLFKNGNKCTWYGVRTHFFFCHSYEHTIFSVTRQGSRVRAFANMHLRSCLKKEEKCITGHDFFMQLSHFKRQVEEVAGVRTSIK